MEGTKPEVVAVAEEVKKEEEDLEYSYPYGKDEESVTSSEERRARNNRRTSEDSEGSYYSQYEWKEVGGNFWFKCGVVFFCVLVLAGFVTSQVFRGSEKLDELAAVTEAPTSL
eukprot:maker-scaffold_35-snap-gene-2.90-mRNA-1 protein AED:0.00 eAED:0.00 QI:31/1/1/1/1/1/2/100/112